MVDYLAHHQYCDLITYRTATCSDGSQYATKCFKYMPKINNVLVHENNFDNIKSIQNKLFNNIYLNMFYFISFARVWMALHYLPVLFCRRPAHHFKIAGSRLSYLLYCRKVPPRLWSLFDPGKCIVIPVSPYTTECLSNGVYVLQPDQSTSFLGILVSCDVPRGQAVERVIYRMMQQCRTWENKTRTYQGRGVVATSLVLSTLWYILSVLPTHQMELYGIQRVIL